HLALLCRDLSEIAEYARVDNKQFRLLKATTPGPFTVILEATRAVPRRLSHPSRKTIGLRVPENAIALALLEELGQPLISSTLILPGDGEVLNDAEDIRERIEKQLDLIIDGGACPLEPTTVIDLTGAEPVLMRHGRGDPALFGL
ncbi:MAG: L-threonylcarbamoyladenylate synthase, partial [Telluria sp.]